uniref:interaptin-like n=1 Tax=Monopterus albus TaxID=43700 RepID=UPI0009B32AD7|nr:interaptin-like [Monopterus albus]
MASSSDSYQKAKTESFINKEKETRKELERLRQYSDAEALSASNIATQVGNDIKRKKKKDLQRDYEELKVAYAICQDRFTGELNTERNKISALQEELEKLRASHHELSVKNQKDALALKQQVESLHSEHETENKSHGDTVVHYLQLIDTLKAEKDALQHELQTEKLAHADRIEKDLQLIDTLQCELENEKLTHADRMEKDLQLIEALRTDKDALQREIETEKLAHADRVEQDLRQIETLRTEKDSLSQKMAEEMMSIQKEADHKVMVYEGILEQLETMLDMQVTLNNQLLAKLNAEEVTNSEEHDDPEEQHEDGQCEDQDSLPGALHDELTENAVVSEQIVTGTTKPKSRWKRFRHFLGLRKPQKWKK